jgi:DNA-binding transcriptional LysR family regulator
MRPYTFKQIQTFMEVARQRSVSKAAERLFVTQPAVSMQLRQLEDAFGLALVEPMGRNIQLTAAGEAFLTLCHQRHGAVQGPGSPDGRARGPEKRAH